MDEQALIQKAKRDPEAFGTVIAQYEKPLLVFLRRISGVREEEIEDLLQESFLTAWKYIGSYNPKYSFKNWLYRIARQQAILAFRKRSTQNHGYLAEEDIETFSEKEGEDSPEKEVEHQLQKECIREILNDLPPLYREVLLLRYVEDLEYTDIADILKKPTGTIATLLHRAKKAFHSHHLIHHV